MDSKILNELKQVLICKDSLPFLFIGSGFTRRYLGAPDWSGLLKNFCNMLNPDDDYLFHTFSEQARQNIIASGGNPSSTNELNSKIADIIENNFNLLWYKDKKYETNRVKYRHLVEAGSKPFKIEMANYFNELNNSDFLLSNELEALKDISTNSIAGIITTNYDCFLENFFDMDVYIGQERLLFSNSNGFCELYKIHGCCTEPKSIIIDSEDYMHFENQSKYLAAKLLTIFVEHPIIFIGYSMQDENIRSIIDSILDCLNNEQLLLFKKRFIFIDRIDDNFARDVKIEDTIYSSSTGKTLTMTKILLNDYSVLYNVLAENRSKYPTKLLKKLKNQVYELVTSTSPSEKLKIMLPFEKMDDWENVEFVVGVGISRATDLAYASYSAEDIYHDIVFDDKAFIPDLLIENTLPPHLSRTCGSMPIYKYLSRYSKKVIPETIEKYIKDSIDNFYNQNIINTRSKTTKTSIKEIEEQYKYPKNLYYVVRLHPKYLDAQELQEYLKKILEDNPKAINTGPSYPQSSDLRRMIKILDFLLYKNS